MKRKHVCCSCGSTKDLKPDRDQCYPCHRSEHVVRMAKRRIQWKHFLLDNVTMVCEKCGYDKSRSAIDFHHRDETKKDFAIGNWTNGRFAFNKENQQTVLQEIKKCDILCANCHRELHFNLNKENKEI